MKVFCPSCESPLELGADACKCGWTSVPPQPAPPRPAPDPDPDLRGYENAVAQGLSTDDQVGTRRLLENWGEVLLLRSRELESDRQECAHVEQTLAARAEELKQARAELDQRLSDVLAQQDNLAKLLEEEATKALEAKARPIVEGDPATESERKE